MNFNYSNPYLSTRLPVFARNVVSTSHPVSYTHLTLPTSDLV